MFWRNNILGFAPSLPVNVAVGGDTEKVTLLGTYFSKPLQFGKETFVTGVRMTDPWWRVQGSWPDDASGDVLLGRALAAKLGRGPGDQLEIAGAARRVVGVLSSGSVEDDQIVAPLGLAQQILGRPGAVRRIAVSALTKPEDALARRDPRSLSPAMYDRWYCSPYPQSIAYQLEEAIPHSHAEQIRQVAQTEGVVLSSITGLMLLITLAALLASALAVSAAMATTMFERSAEVGLMKALGASSLSIAAVFFAEATLLALIGGAAGFAGGAWLADRMGRSIFGSQIAIPPVLLPVVLGMAVIVTFAGSAVAIRRAVKLDPVYALRGEA
jgi:putative ABC transport system permease protein